MIHKKIKKNYLNNVGESGSNMQNREYINLNNLWHDANEKPRTKEWLLVQFDEDDYDTIYLYIDIWCDWCKTSNVSRWAYISDLLPKGGKK